MAVLCISREFGSDGQEIGRELADQLHYAFVDKETILREMKEVGERWERLGRDLDEVCPTLWERYDWEYRGFVALMESYILISACKDNVVIMGRGSNVLLRDIPFVLNVRFVAPVESRIERVMLRDNMARQTAQWLVEKMDQEKACYVMVNYGKNWVDVKNYDMIFNTGLQPKDQVIRVLRDSLQERDALATPEAKKRLTDLALAARVKARIATDSRLFVPTLDVSHDGAGLVLRGITHRQADRALAEAHAREVAGSIPIQNELHSRT